MAQRYLISVDIGNVENGLDLRTIAFLAPILITVKPESLTDVMQFVREQTDALDIYCDCSFLRDIDEIVRLLDNGCHKVFLHRSVLSRILEGQCLEEGQFSRLVLDFRSSTASEDAAKQTELLEAVGTYSKKGITGLGYTGSSMLFKSASSSLKLKSPFYIEYTADTVSSSTECIRQGAIAILPSNALTAKPSHHNLFPLYRLITDVLSSDRLDGLFPTVVTDERGVSLGMVYSNEESIAKAMELGRGVYHSRSRNKLWIKGEESGNIQELVSISIDCDADALEFKVRQIGEGFCHLGTATCFGANSGISKLEETLQSRKRSAPEGSYTARLFSDPKLLQAKIMEEANELCEAAAKQDVADEAADLIYFAVTKCTAEGVSFKDIENSLDRKSMKVRRRKGDAKPRWAEKVGLPNGEDESIGAASGVIKDRPDTRTVQEAASVPKAKEDPSGVFDGKIKMKRYVTAHCSPKTITDALQRPSQRATDDIMNVVKPIINEVRAGGDAAVLKYTHKFERAVSLTSPVLKAPFAKELMELPPETIEAIDTSFENIRRFHAAQKEETTLKVETMPGVVCSRFSRPIERVGLYVPGGTAVLPSTALMLGVPAMVAGCKKIVLASPPRTDGSITPEIVYVANKIGAESIVQAGGAQAIAALAYGTESVSKVDKILGPGNQFVTAGKMIVSNDTTAGVSIDMPAGPSEVLVIADKSANPAFVVSDLLSQAEHGTDSQVVLIAVNLGKSELEDIEEELHSQANALPRVDIVRGAIEHSVTLVVRDIEEAMKFSNQYAPEHLILQVENAQAVVDMVENAGSVFVGPWTPESVGDYSAGVNHSLPTYGYAKQYSGVNLSSFTKHITSSNLTKEGLRNVSGAVMQLAKVEELEAHRRAVSIRLDLLK